MARVKIAAGDWVVVCDGSKALICSNAGDEKFINLKVIEEREIDNPPTRDQGAERPGRVRDSGGTRRSAMEQTDWHDEAERAFLRQLADRLHEAVTAGTTRGIILAAPPRALGMLRPLLSHQTVAVVRAEIAKDYVKLPVIEIEQRLTA
jgi:protein required for attachment to host cells